MADGLTPKQQKELNSLTAEFVKLQESLIKNGRLGVKQQERYQKIQERINGLHGKEIQLIEEKAKKSDEQLSFEKKAEKIAQSKGKQARKALLTGKSHAKQYDEALTQEGAWAKAQSKRGDLSKKQIEVVDEHLDLIGDLGTGTLDLSALEEKRASLMVDAEEDKAGLGADYYKSLDDQLQKRIEMGRAAELEAKAVSGLDDLTDGMATKIKDIKDQWVAMGKGGIAVAVLAVTAAVVILTSFSGKLDAIGEKFGAIGVQSGELQSNLLASEAEAIKLGKGLEDVAESITTLTSEFGVGFKEAQSMANEVISISMGLGLSTSEGGQLIGTLSTIAGLSNDTAVALAQQTTLLATASDVAPQQVLKDIAGSSETVAKFTDASGKNILRGAIQARKLGTSLEDAAAAAESMLDFQTAIESAMTASVMTGRDINIQKLQELSLAGDLEGVSKEQRRLLGDQSDFLSMNILQREALAKAVGLSVDQAAKMLDKEEDAITLAGELAKQEGFETLIGPEAISSLTELMGSLKSIGAVIVNSFGPALNSIVGWLAPIVSLVGAMVSGIEKWIGMGPALIGVLIAWKTNAMLAAAASIYNAIAGFFGAAASMSAVTLGFGTLAAVGIASTAVAMMMGSLAKAGDMVSPADGKTVVSTKEGGLFEMSKNDDLLAGPGIAGAGGDGTSSAAVTTAIRSLTARVNVLIENFDDKYVPAIVQSNIDGGKGAGKQMGRTLIGNV